MCKHGEEPVFETAWGTSSFHTERVQRAKDVLQSRGYKQNRTHATLDYLTREQGKQTLDFGAGDSDESRRLF